MLRHTDWNELRNQLRLFFRWTVAGVIDSIFLILWVLVQWGNQKLMANLDLFGIDKWLLIAFQILFAISTLASVVIYIVTDISVMVIQARKRIKKEVDRL